MLTDRQAEVLAAYAQSPRGLPITHFIESVHMTLQTLYMWKRHPEFAAEWDRVRHERQRVEVSFADPYIDAIIGAQVDKALLGDTPAARIVLEIVGVLKSPIAQQNVKIVQTGRDEIDVLADEEQAQQLLDRQARIRDQILRRLERDKALTCDSGDPGPEDSSEGPAE